MTAKNLLSASFLQSFGLRTKLLPAISMLLILGGCGGSSDTTAAEEPVDATGTLTLLLTDAAVDTAIEVWVEFAGVEIKPQGGESFRIEFEAPVKFDLLQLTGDNTVALLQDEAMPAGGYNWIRLDVNADESCTNDLAEDTGNAVYLFAGSDVTPEDIHAEETDPISTALVEQDENGLYRYSMSFLSPGDYTISFTCQSLDDEADVNDEIQFTESANVTIIADEESLHDFGAESENP